MMIMITIMTVILKGAIRYFYNLLTAPRTVVNPHSSIGGRLGKQTCKPLHHA